MSMSYILFSLIMFVIEIGNTSGMTVKKGLQLETEDASGNLPVVYGDWENENDGLITTRRKREVAGNVVKEEKLNHMKKLLEKLYGYKNFGKPKTSNALISNGWGAGGMPFNVLYTPNSHQQKILRRLVPKKNPKQSPQREKDLVHKTDDSRRRKDELGQKKQQQQQQRGIPRKYFSVIPQLFASYGWRTRY